MIRGIEDPDIRPFVAVVGAYIDGRLESAEFADIFIPLYQGHQPGTLAFLSSELYSLFLDAESFRTDEDYAEEVGSNPLVIDGSTLRNYVELHWSILLAGVKSQGKQV